MTKLMTRGGFYKHFKSKEGLYEEVLVAYAKHREQAAASSPIDGRDLARYIINTYVSREHLEDVDSHCPLMALPSDSSRSSDAVRQAYERVLEALVEIFSTNLDSQKQLTQRQVGLAAASTCVGAMVLARTVTDTCLADEICEAARAFANGAIIEGEHD